jgi:hypothetical protein
MKMIAIMDTYLVEQIMAGIIQKRLLITRFVRPDLCLEMVRDQKVFRSFNVTTIRILSTLLKGLDIDKTTQDRIDVAFASVMGRRVSIPETDDLILTHLMYTLLVGDMSKDEWIGRIDDDDLVDLVSFLSQHGALTNIMDRSKYLRDRLYGVSAETISKCLSSISLHGDYKSFHLIYDTGYDTGYCNTQYESRVVHPTTESQQMKCSINPPADIVDMSKISACNSDIIDFLESEGYDIRTDAIRVSAAHHNNTSILAKVGISGGPWTSSDGSPGTCHGRAVRPEHIEMILKESFLSGASDVFTSYYMGEFTIPEDINLYEVKTNPKIMRIVSPHIISDDVRSTLLIQASLRGDTESYMILSEPLLRSRDVSIE